MQTEKSKTYIEFQDWLKTASLEDRTLLQAWRAGRKALLDAEVLPPPEKNKKREWRTVHPRWNQVFTVRGLSNRGEVIPHVTDGDKVIVKEIVTGRTFPTFFKNLVRVESGVNHSKPKKPTTTKTKQKKTTKVAQAMIDEVFNF